MCYNPDKMQNYIKLTNFSLINVHYAYFDAPEYLGDQIFVQKNLKIKFGNELKHQGEAYILVFCKIRKRDEHLFLEAMEELKNKMLLLGYTDYLPFCEKMCKMF